MKRVVLCAAAALLGANLAGAADEAATSFDKIFRNVCLAKFAEPGGIEAWAADQALAPITNPQALAVFAGKPNRDGKMVSVAGGGVPGSGKAWAVPDPAGRFVLATRLDPESCVVWAQRAEPASVEADFAKLLAEVAKPGMEVNLAEDKTSEVPIGQVHIRVYRVWGGSAMNSLAIALASVNHAGGPFQAMLEAQRLFGRDDAVNPMVPLDPPG